MIDMLRRVAAAICLVLFASAASAHGLWITLNTPHGTHDPTPGHRHLFADVRELVSGNPDLARHEGKVLAVYYSTSLSIDVKP